MSRNLIKLLALINIQNKLPSLILHWRDIILMPNNTNKSKLTKPTFSGINSLLMLWRTCKLVIKMLLCVINMYFEKKNSSLAFLLSDRGKKFVRFLSFLRFSNNN